MLRRAFAIRHLTQAAIVALLAVPGCRNGVSDQQWRQIEELKAECTELELQVQKLQAENQRLTEQLDALASIKKDVRLEALDKVAAIELSPRTGLYDKDDNGTKETLVVYLRVIDEAGDAVKETGAVEVQLWDLNAPEAEALLAKWQIAPEDLTNLWVSTIMTNYYRLTFDTANLNLANRKELTVKATFTDYLTGKTLRQQTTITP